MARGDLLIVMGDMNARVGNDVSGVSSLAGVVRKYAMRMAGDFCSSVVSTVFGIPTPGFHTKESTSTHGNVQAKGSGLSLATSWWERRLGSR